MVTHVNLCLVYNSLNDWIVSLIIYAQTRPGLLQCLPFRILFLRNWRRLNAVLITFQTHQTLLLSHIYWLYHFGTRTFSIAHFNNFNGLLLFQILTCSLKRFWGRIVLFLNVCLLKDFAANGWLNLFWFKFICFLTLNILLCLFLCTF